MDSKECSDDPLFVELVELLHNLNPSANSAYYLGLLNDKKNNSELALSFTTNRLSLKPTISKRQEFYKDCTKFKNTKQFFKSRNYANKALKYQPSMGKAYLLIGNLYASSANNCGTSQFEKRSIYWLALKRSKKSCIS